jgi:small-conductance mechanosensitive channel
VSLLHRLFGHVPDLEVTLEALVIALAMAALCAHFAGRVARGLLARAMAGGESVPSTRNARATVRAIRVLVLIILTGVFVPPVLELFGEPVRTGLRLRALLTWILDGGLRVLLISALAYGLHRAIALLMDRFERSLGASASLDAIEHDKRTRTLTSLVANVANVFIVTTASLMILSELHVNTTPILASAGILGLAVGFGAQTLVKDVISGFFMILENQIRVGDAVELNGVSGLVETLHLRTVVLRDIRGAVHVFPCGAITTITNLTKDYSYAVVDVQVPLDQDADAAIDAIRAIGDELLAEREWKVAVLEPLEVLGVETLGGAGMTIRARIKTVPLRQWDVAREMRRRMQKQFATRGIDLRLVQKMVLQPPTGADGASNPTL